MSLAEVKERVQTYLVENANNVQIDKYGRWSFRHESARVFVGVREFGDDGRTVVEIISPVLSGLAPSAELNEYVAYHADDYRFGHLSLERFDDGTVTLFMSHRLLGDYLDKDELMFAAFGVLASANELDDELQARFGGQIFHE